MGYGYQLVAISKDRIEALWCSRDDALFERMRAPTNEYAQSLMRIGTRDEEALRDALRYVLIGGGQASKPHEIGYAVEACCFELGESVGEIDTRDVERVESLLDGVELFPGVSERWPIPIPDTPEYPLVGMLPVAQLAAVARSLSAITGVDVGSDEGLALDAARGVFEDAAKMAIDVIVFLH
jgi:hypothetical protein